MSELPIEELDKRIKERDKEIKELRRELERLENCKVNCQCPNCKSYALVHVGRSCSNVKSFHCPTCSELLVLTAAIAPKPTIFHCDICLQDKSVKEKHKLNCCSAGNICVSCYGKIKPNGNKICCPFCRTGIDTVVEIFDGFATEHDEDNTVELDINEMPSIFLNSDGIVVDNHANGSEYKLLLDKFLFIDADDEFVFKGTFQDGRAEFTDEFPEELLTTFGLEYE